MLRAFASPTLLFWRIKCCFLWGQPCTKFQVSSKSAILHNSNLFLLKNLEGITQNCNLLYFWLTISMMFSMFSNFNFRKCISSRLNAREFG